MIEYIYPDLLNHTDVVKDIYTFIKQHKLDEFLKSDQYVLIKSRSKTHQLYGVANGHTEAGKLFFLGGSYKEEQPTLVWIMIDSGEAGWFKTSPIVNVVKIDEDSVELETENSYYILKKTTL